MSIIEAIKQPKADIFRRIFIKRRSQITGLYEEDWLDVTSDVKSFGKVKQDIDSVRLYQFSFSNMKVTFENDSGRYNPSTSDFSLWNGFLNQQRTLVKVEIGFITRYQRDDGFWVNKEYQGAVLWDEASWDSEDEWDFEESPIVFTGIISGDIPLSDKDEVTFTIKPLTSVFDDFPAVELTGWTSTGMTASQFMGMLRDQQDGNGNYIFRGFFGDTVANWDISATSSVYSQLNTSGAEGVYDKTVWEVIQTLSEAENYVPYITPDGHFKFVSREANQTATVYQFHGAGSFNNEYGQTIKQVTSYGQKISKYYSRVEVKFKDTSTSDSTVYVSSAYEVTPSSNPFVLGHRTLSIQNYFIPNTASALVIANQVFDDYSALKNEIEFKTSLVPHLNIFDRIALYYDPTEPGENSLWDLNNWAGDDTSTSQDLTWDSSPGDAIILEGQEFKFLSMEIDIDNLECRFVAREV